MLMVTQFWLTSRGYHLSFAAAAPKPARDAEYVDALAPPLLKFKYAQPPRSVVYSVGNCPEYGATNDVAGNPFGLSRKLVRPRMAAFSCSSNRTSSATGIALFDS